MIHDPILARQTGLRPAPMGAPAEPLAWGAPHLWIAAAGSLIALACLSVLALALFVAPPRHFHFRPLARPAGLSKPDDVAVLLNNTPLAIAPADAVALNAARKLDRARIAAARPFLLPALSAAQGVSALDCLTQAIYYEAASESDTGERAVAQVVLNRVRNPIFPHSVCGVVFQGSQLPTGCQFSFACDGSLARRPSEAGWARARRIAAAALAGRVEASVGLATHYHANYVVPHWAGSLDKVATIGAHIFYIMRGGRGAPSAFAAAYDGSAEAPPSMTLDAAALEALIGANGASAAATGGRPPERTVVQEDALGAPAAPARPLAITGGALKVDDAPGELLADKPKIEPSAGN